MNKILGSILRMAVSAFLPSPLRRVRIRAVIYYLRVIQTARTAAMTVGALIFCLAMMAGGAVLIPLGLCLFMPWQPQTKALVACAFGAIYLLVPLFVAMTLMSERRWMRMTRADVLVRDILAERSSMEGDG